MVEEDPLVTQCRARLGALISGKWRLDALIGVGGMAAVYAATHRNGSVAAIKLLHPEIANNQEVKTRFLREAYIANKVGHSGTVQVLDDDQDDATGAAYIVMELLKGSTVDSKAEKNGGRLSIQESLEIADQTLAVLEAAHANQIIHRDLKPANLFFTASGEIKLLDFGIARLREENTKQTQTGMVMGTPAFMAPEQAMGRWSDVDGRTDLWAVGAIMFTLISGMTVHEGETAGELQVAAATRPARSLARVVPDAPLAVVRLIDRALAYEREQRFQDAKSFRAQLALVRAELFGDKEQAKSAVLKATAANREAPPRPKRAARPNFFQTQKLYESYDPSALTPEEIDKLAKVFQLVERAFTGQEQYGDEHPETRRRFNEAYRETSSILAESDDALGWNINPYSFFIGDKIVWEPKEPWNRVPYQLFSDGVRLMGLVPGIDEEEFMRWVKLITLDPVSEMSPEDDLVTMLWDAAFESVFYQAIDSFSEGDQEQRASFEETRRKIVADALIRPEAAIGRAWVAEKRERESHRSPAQKTAQIRQFLMRGQPIDTEAAAQAAELELGKDTQGGQAASLIDIDPDTRTLFGARLEPDIATTSERFVVAAAQAFVSAWSADDAASVAAPLRNAVDGLSHGAPLKAMEMLRTLREAVTVEGDAETTERVRGALADELLSADTLGAILTDLPEPADPGHDDYLKEISYVLSNLSAGAMPVVIEALVGPRGPLLRPLGLAYLERVGKGHEGEIGALFARADLELSLALLRALAKVQTPEAKQAVAMAAKSPHPLVRIEALSNLEGASSAQLRNEMRALLEDRDAAVRLAALRAMEKYRISAAGPFLVLRICAPEFFKLDHEEKNQALKSLCTLRPKRGEEVCIQLLSESKLIRSRAFEETRELAAQYLAEVASTNPALYLLEEVAKGSKWAYSHQLRKAAQAALDRLGERANQYISSKNQQPAGPQPSAADEPKGQRGQP
jgi:eukaryotic-like serine/threonine-protein kinase